MKVEDFLAGKYLLRSDVLLTRRDWDFWSSMIRWATTSPFSHAALVFTSPTQEVGINNTFVIEAGTSGVALTNLRDYINDKSEFVAIKRLKQPWWDEEKQNRIRGLLLDNIKSEYNYWAIVRVIRNIWFGVERSVRGRRHTIAEFEKRDWRRPNEFICSGLVQFGFVEGISEYVLARKLPPWALNDVVFGQDAERRLIGKGRWEQLKAELKPADYEALIDANIPAARGVLSPGSQVDHARGAVAVGQARMAVRHQGRTGAQDRLAGRPRQVHQVGAEVRKVSPEPQPSDCRP